MPYDFGGFRRTPVAKRHQNPRRSATSPRHVTRSLDESCARLGVDHIDLLHCHDIEFADLDQIVPVRTRWNFLGRRQPQHYGLVLQPVTEKEPNR